MGGNLFSSKRIGIVEYTIMCQDVLEIFKKEGIEAIIPHTFSDKQDFGDIDVCIRLPLLTTSKLKEMFGITDDKDIYWNTTVASLKFKNFQVDVCHFEKEDYDTACVYMPFGDLSNMIGVICNKAFNFRYTHRGLTCPIKLKQEDMLGEVVLSKNLRKIFQFIDLDYDQYDRGFKNELESFKWIANSKYFNKEFFKFENLNHQNRTRNRKRKMYSRFVDWLENEDGNRDFIIPYNHIPTENKMEQFWRAVLVFEPWDKWGAGDHPNFIDEAVSLVKDREFTQTVAERFNATHIIKNTGLAGAELGRFIKEFKQYIANEYPVDYGTYDVYVYYHTTSEIERLCLKFFNNHFKRETTT